MDNINYAAPFEPLYLSVAGYKSLYHEQTVKIAPLTILAGANSSGKSSFMQPFLLIKQTMEAPFESETFLLDGNHVSITEMDQIFSRIGEHSSEVFSVGLKSDNQGVAIEYVKKGSIDIKSIIFFMNNDSFQFKLNKNYYMPSFKMYVMFKKNNGFFNLFIPNENQILESDKKNIISNNFENFEFSFILTMQTLIRNLIHLPGLRGTPKRSYKQTATKFENGFQGTFEPYTASIINYWATTAEGHAKLDELNQDLHALGLTQKIQAQKLNAAYLELYVSRTSTVEDMVNIADVGLGVSQTLPILVALLIAEPGQLVYIEQPELHLHPKAQYSLAGIVAKAAKRGVRVILETHSSLLLLAVQTLVAKEQLHPELVALHWFTRDPDSGETQVTSAELDENGAFGDWPEDFDDVYLKAEQAYLDAVERKSL